MLDRDDLLRVDSTGAVHPVGRGASRNLRLRAGEWQLVASPKNVIFARSVALGNAALKLAGEIRTPGALADIIALAAQSGWRGELVVLSQAAEQEHERTFAFDHGTLINASTTVPEERLGETLYRFGHVTREQLDRIVRTSETTGKRFGEVAVESGVVSAETLYAMMVQQVEHVFFAAIRVSEGTFYFFDQFDENAIARRHNLSASGLLIEAARRMDEMRFFREKIPSDEHIPMPVAGKIPSDELRATFAQCNARQSIADIGRATGRSEFEVTRAVFQLVSTGCVTVVAPRPHGAEAIVETFNPALVLVHARCDAAGGAKGAEFREGLSRFATGGGIYDPLFMGAGPLPDGSLKPDRLARNIAALAGDDPDAWLVELIHDYLGFALFQAESMLSREAQTQIRAEISDMLTPLRPLIEASANARTRGVM